MNQVVEQAHEKYGLTVLGFTGSASNYDPTAKADYRSADRVAVTTYSSLFNTNPFFNDADVVIVDDAHAAESYIAALWSVRISRNTPEHKSLHTALSNVLKPLLNATNFTRLVGEWENTTDRDWIDKLPTPEFISIKDEIIEVLDAHATDTDLRYSWSMLRDHLHACQLYLSSQEILIRPLIPPTWTHAAFHSPKQRIFMSATLGSGGDLERLMGRKKIHRLPIQKGWDRQGVGRRFFIFPSMSLKDDGVIELRRALMERAGRSVAMLGANDGITNLAPKARAQFKQAKDAAKDLPWLASLARYQGDKTQEPTDNPIRMEQIERVEAILSRLGTTHDRAFAKREKEILDGLKSGETFEQAHRLLGELLGFDTGKVETDASPDPWWMIGNLCFVFEDHAGANTETVLGANKARQAASHPQWMRTNVEASKKSQILPVLITPVTKAKEGAMPHLGEVALWPLNEFNKWASDALATVRTLRSTLLEPGDLAWRAQASEAFEQNDLDALGLFTKLKSRSAAGNLIQTK